MLAGSGREWRRGVRKCRHGENLRVDQAWLHSIELLNGRVSFEKLAERLSSSALDLSSKFSTPSEGCRRISRLISTRLRMICRLSVDGGHGVLSTLNC